MKLSKITIICLVSTAIVLASVLIVQAAGFISYENDNQIIVWDPVRLVGKGLKMSNLGINDLENIPDGVIKVDDKDLYVRSFMGFDCTNYPTDTTACTTKIGDIGGSAFLSIDTVKGEVLSLLAPNSGIKLDAPNLITMKGKVVLESEAENNLVLLSDEDSSASSVIIDTAINSVFVEHLFTEEIMGDDLNMPDIYFESGSYFEPLRIINITL